MYADTITDSMKKAIEETDRRRKLQDEYNKKHGIIPQTIYKTREEILKTTAFADSRTTSPAKEEKLDFLEKLSLEDKIRELQKAMKQSASNLEFEKAAFFRDELAKLVSKRGKGKSKSRDF
jgi:excinuclease ABC subunit B